MIKVGAVTATTTEKKVELGGVSRGCLMLKIGANCSISINGNKNYIDYFQDEMIPLTNPSGTLDNLYVKTTTGQALIRYWLMD